MTEESFLRSGRLALDTEFVWTKTYYARLGLVQAAASGGLDIDAALRQIDGYHQEETTQPEEPDNGHKPGENGDYDINGNWVPYNEGSNGDWVNGTWTWYVPEENGYWDENGKWQWGKRPVDTPDTPDNPDQGQTW